MSSSWWDKKLGTPQTPARPQVQQPAQPTYYPPAGDAPRAMPAELEGHRLPASAASADRCPNCASGNYGRTTPESRARCYDCGYPIQQSGSGVPGVRVPTEGPVQAARQVDAGGFNPGTIVDRIG
jgi:hypothetical protein